jgi:hypothetical protein
LLQEFLGVLDRGWIAVRLVLPSDRFCNRVFHATTLDRTDPARNIPIPGCDKIRAKKKTPGSFLPGVPLDKYETIEIRSYAERGR